METEVTYLKQVIQTLSRYFKLENWCHLCFEFLSRPHCESDQKSFFHQLDPYYGELHAKSVCDKCINICV